MRSESITIVTHCYSPPGCDLYLQHLKWQLSSLLHHPVDGHVNYVVYHDEAAAALLHTAPLYINGLTVISRTLPANQLLRRAIGRHMEARQCETDVIWFADADYYFGAGCLDDVLRQVSSNDGLRFPRQVLENINQAAGDKMIEEKRLIDRPLIDKSLFKPRRRQFAIGGLQIVGGRRAKDIGYLGGTKWTEPIDPANGWYQTGEDVHFRKEFASSQPIDVKNLYWIRHNLKGADMDGTGALIGKEVW